MPTARVKPDLCVSDPNIAWPAAHSPGSSRVFAQNVIEIAASRAVVWSLLIDCEAWPGWYKHCSDVSILRNGPLLRARSKFRFKTLGIFFEPEIDTYEPFRLLVWSAKGPLGTSGAHAWFIEPVPGGCRVTTEETQIGSLLFFAGARVRRTLLSSHEEWLRALKALAEARPDLG